MPRNPAPVVPMPRKAIVLRMPGGGNGNSPQPPDNTPSAITNRRITGLLAITRDRIGYAFLGGSKMRTLRVSYDLPMEALEEVIREQMRERLNRRQIERRAA